MAQKRNYSIFETNPEKAVESKKRKNEEPLKIYSWNVAGLRSCVSKRACDKEIAKWNADIVFLQETKCAEFPPEIQRMSEFPYKKLCISVNNKGAYAGVAMLSKEKPISVKLGIDNDGFDDHARLIQAEFDNFYVLGVYVPNSGTGLKNLDKRKQWEELMLAKITALDKVKPVIYVGDMNVAHNEIDIKNPESNRNKSPGFTDQEREDFGRLLDAGFTDVYRKMNPDKTGAYTYWTYRGNARAKNVGWRLDYFVVSERIFDKVIDCDIHADIPGSDHCPISMTIAI
ncbi:endonuclease/Exonuclease/phosphatase family domain-containing protein [Ditylenchus destructor]|uniref:exodeoxyribonuclease III n=1 Tax=Ditylenchus destructor TaxID=166010 RepID=A0AAD4N8C9_9BILA|nr:endonuclease/Exonuclease/phosphatase family domain-containing protein [Ditylenchus destructor]